MEKDLIFKIKYLIEKNYSVEYICNYLNIRKIEFFYALKYFYTNKIYIPTIFEPYIIDNNKEHIKLILMSDTHLCNKSDRIDLIRDIYEEAEEIGVDYIFHAGDLVDGYPFVLGYEKELREKTYDGQLEYVINNYPSCSAKTYVISGNHEDFWYQRKLKDIIEDVSKRRDDIINLGGNKRDVIIGNTRIILVHGNRFNDSKFMPNKYLNSLLYKPNILHSGHLHKSHYDIYNNTYYFRTSSLCNGNAYAERKQYINEKSIYIVDLYLDDYGNLKKVDHKIKKFK